MIYSNSIHNTAFIAVHSRGFKIIFLKILFIYLFMRNRERERERERERQREKQVPCREPDVGLDPGSPGSRLGLKAGTEPLSHPGIPQNSSI